MVAAGSVAVAVAAEEEEEAEEGSIELAAAAAAAAAAIAAAAASSAAVLPPPPFAPALGMSSLNRYLHSALGPARIEPSSSRGAWWRCLPSIKGAKMWR